MRRSLVFSVDYPFPADKGSKQRTVAFVEQLARHGEVDLLCYRKYSPDDVSRSPFGQVYLIDLPSPPRTSLVRSAIEKLVQHRPAITAPFTAAVVRWIHALIMDRNYEVAVCRDLVNAFPLMSLPADLRTRVLLDFGDVMTPSLHAKVLRDTGTVDAAKARLEQWVYLNHQRRACTSFSVASFCSRDEAAILQSWAGATKLHVIPNVVPSRTLQPGYRRDGFSRRHALLFVGALSYAPNVEAVRWFLTDVFPAFRGDHHDATLCVAGRSPSPDIVSLCASQAAVTLVPDPDDVGPLYDDCGTVVVPLRSGGGTSIKVLEAGGFHRPVLSTPVGIRGLDLTIGQDVLIFDGADSFLQEFSRIDDHAGYLARAKCLSDAVEENYSTAAFATALDAAISIISAGTGVGGRAPSLRHS